MNYNNILERIQNERAFQDRKFGKQNHPNLLWLAILTEEVGEVSKEVLQNNPEELKDEIIQTIAVLFAWLEQLPDNQDSLYE